MIPLLFFTVQEAINKYYYISRYSRSAQAISKHYYISKNKKMKIFFQMAIDFLMGLWYNKDS